jgi:hypothetical protein
LLIPHSLVEALVSRVYFWYKKNFAGTKFAPVWLFSEGVHKSCHHVVVESPLVKERLGLGTMPSLQDALNEGSATIPSWMPPSMHNKADSGVLGEESAIVNSNNAPIDAMGGMNTTLPLSHAHDHQHVSNPSPTKASPRDGCLEVRQCDDWFLFLDFLLLLFVLILLMFTGLKIGVQDASLQAPRRMQIVLCDWWTEGLFAGFGHSIHVQRASCSS